MTVHLLKDPQINKMVSVNEVVLQKMLIRMKIIEAILIYLAIN